jgi:uncharacterized membrane protein YphA (DoxX/SURF4 family)
MEDQEIRRALNQHWAASNSGDFDTEHDIYHDDALLDYPQSRERIRGRNNIQITRTLQPNKKRFAVHRILGSGELWITELVLTYDAKPFYTVSIRSRQRSGVKSGSRLWTARSRNGALHIMQAFFILQGAQAPEAALTLNRVALGTFFAISGYHKLFNAARHATLTSTLQQDGVHAVPIMRWLLPCAEFSGGWALIIGFLSVIAAFGLIVISAGALAFDAVKRIRSWQPLDRADWIGDLLYVPEALYCIGLTVLILGGPGRWSLDALIAAFLAGQ